MCMEYYWSDKIIVNVVGWTCSMHAEDEKFNSKTWMEGISAKKGVRAWEWQYWNWFEENRESQMSRPV